MKKSPRKSLRDKAGKLHRDYLQKIRGNRCEICGQPSDDLARFHIITVAARPRLEFADENILLYARSHWFTCHEPYHRDRDSVKGRRIMEAIRRLRGEDYLTHLYTIERYMQKHSLIYLRGLCAYYTRELERLNA